MKKILTYIFIIFFFQFLTINAQEKNLERIKEYLKEIINDGKILIDEKNIKIVLINIDTLLEKQELDYLEKKFEILQKNVWPDEFALKYYSDYYIRYLRIYYQKNDKKKFKSILNYSINELNKKPKSPLQMIHISRLNMYKLTNLGFYVDNTTQSFNTINEVFISFEQLAKKFEDSDNETKNAIVRLDQKYIAEIYQVLGHLDSINDYTKKRPYYSLLAIEANNKYQLPDSNIIIITGAIINSAIKNDDYKLLTKSLLDLKNISIKHKNDKDYGFSFKESIPINIVSLINVGLYKEAEELVEIIEKNFPLSINNNLNEKEKIQVYFYYTSKSRLETNKNNFKEAIKSLENILLATDFKSRASIRESKNYNLLTKINVESTVPTLLKLYLKSNMTEKFEDLFRLTVNHDFNLLSEKDLVDILKQSNQQWYSPLLSYAVRINDKDKINLISNFLDKNSKEILNESEKASKSLISGSYDVADELLEISSLLAFIDNNSYLTFLQKSLELSKQQYENELFKSMWKPTVLKNEQKVKFLEISSKIKSNNEIINSAYQISQLIKNMTTTRDLNRALLSRNGPGADIYRDYFKLQREIILLMNEESSQNNLENKKKDLLALEEKLKKNNPEYLVLEKIEYPLISDIQKKLNNDEIVLDYFISDNSFALVAIKNNDYKIFTKNFKSTEINSLTSKVKKSLNGMQGIKPYEVSSAYELNKLLFLEYKDYFKDIKKFIIIPDGFLNEIPIHALPIESSQNCIDCSKVKWNFDEQIFTYLPSIDFYAKPENKNTLARLFKLDFEKVVIDNVRSVLDKAQSETTNIFSKIFDVSEISKKNEIISDSKISNAYFGLGDPDLYLDKKSSSKKIDTTEYNRFFRSIGNKGEFNNKKIKEIYGPVLGSADEITMAAGFFNSPDNIILLKSDATETKIKSLDLSKFRVIHFATHGEVSGAIQGINQPFLVLSPPGIETEIDDGLLTMSEIMQLNTNADIVILSACNTASVEDQYSGSFSGLAKAFFISGSKSLLVSNWYVETKATQKLVTKFIKNFSANELSYAENLNLTMREFINESSKNSHPIYWAPFVFVGQDRYNRVPY